MKRNIIPFLGGLLALVLIGAGAMIAQEKTFNVPVPPPPAAGGDNVFFYSNDGDEPDEDVLMTAPHPGQAMAHIRGPQDRKFVFRTGGEGDAWLGVTIGDVNTEKAKELKLAGEYGAFVKEVHENSPAAKAGLLKDDVIVEFAGEKVRSAAQLRRLVRETPADRTITLVVNRAGQTKTLSAKLEAHANQFFEMPTPAIAATPMPHINMPEFNFAWVGGGARLGISADELTPQLAEYFGVKQGKGILVREVVVGSAAEKAGLKAGDVIVAVDGKEVPSVSKLRRALASEKEEERKVALTIVRDKREQTLSVEIAAPERPGPRRVASLGIDPEEAAEMAADAQAQAREWQESQKEFQKEQEELQKEMQRLQEELPKEIEKEIIRNQDLQGLKSTKGVV